MQVPAPQLLIVDDDPAIRVWLRRALEPAGYAVTTASDLESARAKLNVGGFDAMVLDLRLGERSSIELLDVVRGDQRLAPIPVLMLTGVARMTELEESTIRRHAAYVFYKPAAIGEILATLSRVLSPAPSLQPVPPGKA